MNDDVRNGAWRSNRNLPEEQKRAKQLDQAKQKNGAWRSNRNLPEEQKRAGQLEKQRKKNNDDYDRYARWEKTYGPTGNPHLRLVLPDTGYEIVDYYNPNEPKITSTDQAIDIRNGKQITLEQCVMINKVLIARNSVRAPTEWEKKDQERRRLENSDEYKAQQDRMQRWDMQVASQLKDVAVMAGTRGMGGVKTAFGIGFSANAFGQLANGAKWDLTKVDLTDAVIAGGANAVTTKFNTGVVGTVLVQEAGYTLQQGVNMAQGQEGAGVTWQGAAATAATTVGTYYQGKLITGGLAPKTRTINLPVGQGKRGRHGQYIPPATKEVTIVDKKGVFSENTANNVGGVTSSTTQEVMNPSTEEYIKNQADEISKKLNNEK